MTLNSLISLAALGVFLGSAQQEREPMQLKIQPVRAIAKLGTKKAGPSLVVLQWDPSKVEAKESATLISYCLVKEVVYGTPFHPFVEKDSIKGKLPSGMHVLMVRLPEKGKVEVLVGTGKAAPNVELSAIPVFVRTELTNRGYKSFFIDVSEIPIVSAETADELIVQMSKVAEKQTGSKNKKK